MRREYPLQSTTGGPGRVVAFQAQSGVEPQPKMKTILVHFVPKNRLWITFYYNVVNRTHSFWLRL